MRQESLMTTHVLLVDDHPVVRAGLRAVLESLARSMAAANEKPS